MMDAGEFKDTNSGSVADSAGSAAGVGSGGTAAQKEYRYDTKSGTVSLHTYHNMIDRDFSTNRSTSGSECHGGNNFNHTNTLASQRHDGNMSDHSSSLKSAGFKDTSTRKAGGQVHDQNGSLSRKLQDLNAPPNQTKENNNNNNNISNNNNSNHGSTKNLDSCGKENNNSNNNNSDGQRPGEPYRAKATELVVLYDHDTVAEYELPIKRKELVYADLNCQNAEGWYWVYSPRLNEYGYVPRGFVIASHPAMTSL